jgi:hypothetical protein
MKFYLGMDEDKHRTDIDIYCSSQDQFSEIEKNFIN